jgi:hypothetical protein
MSESIECQICMDHFEPNMIEKVACGSSVDHNLCFNCEGTWRSKMPVVKGIKIMNCPTCRQPETTRTIASLQREIASLQRQTTQVRETQRTSPWGHTSFEVSSTATDLSTMINQIIYEERVRRAAAVTPAVARAAVTDTTPTVTATSTTRTEVQRSRCASGRNCRSTSRTGRSMTHLKCTVCNTVFCCRTCSECVGCRPYVLPFVDQLRS